MLKHYTPLKTFSFLSQKDKMELYSIYKEVIYGK